jgi:hypothetical protein
MVNIKPVALDIRLRCALGWLAYPGPNAVPDPGRHRYVSVGIVLKGGIAPRNVLREIAQPHLMFTLPIIEVIQ